MHDVALFVHRERVQAVEVAQQVVAWLEERGIHVRDEEVGADVDLAVAIGGDGTMLRAVDVIGDSGVPVLGVNVGQLGYLTEVEPTDTLTALEKVLAGDHGIEERMMVSIAVEGAGPFDRLPVGALNEAVLEKTPMGHTVRLGVYFDGDFWTTYAADGLIVATPTGSTAYSFSARGPIVDPSHRAIVLTPVSPHMLFDRSMVLDPTTTVRLEVLGPRPATLSVDGRNIGELREGDAVVCTQSGTTARLVTFGGRDFHRILKAKFGLSDR